MIGTAEDIDGFTLDEARAFHRAWYAINNVDFVVMADIEPAVLKEIAERALAGLEPRTLPPRAFASSRRSSRAAPTSSSRMRRPAAGVYFKKLIRIEEDDASRRLRRARWS